MQPVPAYTVPFPGPYKVTRKRGVYASVHKITPVRFNEIDWIDIVTAAKLANIPIHKLLHHAAIELARSMLRGVPNS